jgi:hypothetical protein
MTTTRVTVNITRHEKAVFEFEGDICKEDAVLRIEEGADPTDSNIHFEDIDVVELKVVSA